LGKRGRKGVMLGYNDSNTKGYRIMDLETEKITTSSNVKFFENNYPYKVYNTRFQIHQDQEKDSEDSEENSDDTESTNTPITSSNVTNNVAIPNQVQTRSMTRSNRVQTRSMTSLNMNTPVENAQVENNQVNITKVHSESVATLLKEDEEKWKGAMDHEIEQLASKQTFTEVKQEPYMKVIGTQWIMASKYTADGKFDKVRPRIVLRGDQVDATNMEVFTPVASLETVRLGLALATKNGWKCGDGDIKLAYPNASLKEPVYARIPHGYRNENNKGKVWKVTKALYGHPASGKEWYDLFVKKLKERGLKPLLSDPCIFNSKNLMVIIYVDDMLIIEKKKGEMEKFKNSLEQEFEMTSHDKIENMLGLEIHQGVNETTLIQRGYIRNILQAFDMENCKGQHIPMAQGTTLVYDGKPDKNFEYRKAIGCLLWLTRGTRPDLAQAVSKVSRFVENPTTDHVASVKQIFKYVKQTMNTPLKYHPNEDGIIAYVDADYAGCTDTRRSTSGFWITWAGMAISWSSKLQTLVTLSTTEAELVAAVECIKEMKWLKNVLMELDEIRENDRMILYEDNQATIANLKKHSSHGRNKHVDIKYHYVCAQIHEEQLDVVYMESEKNIADIFTKPLARPAFQKHFESMFRMRGGVEIKNQFQNQVEVLHDGKQKVASKSQSDKSHTHVTWQVQHQNQGIQKSS
jgi:hypothetical protein